MSLRNKQLNIPLKLFHSSESGVEQVSLESDLTDNLQKDRKFLTSDDDLRRILDNQRKENEKLNSRLLGRKKIEDESNSRRILYFRCGELMIIKNVGIFRIIFRNLACSF